MGWIMGTRLNIFTQTEQVEFIPISLCHDQFIEYRHYFLSLARSNDVKTIIVQECRGLSWNLQDILFNRRRQGKMCSLLDQQLFIWEPLNIFIVVFSLVRLDKEKKNSEKHTKIFLEFLVFLNKQIKGKSKNGKKLFTRESSQHAKEEQGNLFGFSFNTIAN